MNEKKINAIAFVVLVSVVGLVVGWAEKTLERQAWLNGDRKIDQCGNLWGKVADNNWELLESKVLKDAQIASGCVEPTK